MDGTDPLGVNRGSAEARLGLAQADNAYTLIERLRDRRRALGLTQTDVATRMRRHQSVVSNIERLGSDPQWSSLRRYATALGVAIRYELSSPDERTALRDLDDADQYPPDDPIDAETAARRTRGESGDSSRG